MESTLILVEQDEKRLSLLYQNNRLVKANAYEKEGSSLESIFIGKVKNVLPSLEAAFVEFQPGQMGFLPMKNVLNPILINRSYDKRLSAGDEIIVQVEKEGMKNKIPGLTCNLSFTGKYCVITTGLHKTGYSSKLTPKKKNRIKDFLQLNSILEGLRLQDVGIVIRTNAGELEDLQPLLTEMEDLIEKKNRILSTAIHRTCFTALYKAPPAYLMEIRDLYGFSYDRILTDKEEIFREIQEAFPDQSNVSLYQDDSVSLSRLYRVKTCLDEALNERVWLKSGAYLIIQPTEALTVIDVNSGKKQKGSLSQDPFFNINMEAAREIALQLKLRNISGIIIVDFINQSSAEQDRLLLQELTRLVEQDSVKTSVIGMTALGLVEITRKKVSKPLKEQLAMLQIHAR